MNVLVACLGLVVLALFNGFVVPQYVPLGISLLWSIISGGVYGWYVLSPNLH